LSSGALRVKHLRLVEEPAVPGEADRGLRCHGAHQRVDDPDAIVAADVGIKASSRRFAYAAQGSTGSPGTADFLGENADGTAAADAASSRVNNAVSTGAFAVVGPRSRASCR